MSHVTFGWHLANLQALEKPEFRQGAINISFSGAWGKAVFGCATFLSMAGAVQADSMQFHIETPGLADETYENPVYPSDGFIFEILDDGKVFGTGKRNVEGPNRLNELVWFDNGSTTKRLGYFNSTHTGPNGEQLSYLTAVNQAGLAAGSSNYYNGKSGLCGNGTLLDCGRSAWFYDGSSMHRPGIYDDAHSTHYNWYKWSEVDDMNEAGQVLGSSRRYLSSFNSSYVETPWLYDSGELIRLGLFDAGHTDYSGGQKNVARQLGENGHVSGYAERYDEAGNDLGQSAWYYDGVNTAVIGLDGQGYAHAADGTTYSFINDFQGPNHIVGRSKYWGVDGASSYSFHTWLFDGVDYALLGLTDPVYTNPVWGNQWHIFVSMADNGHIFGTSSQYTSAGTSSTETKTPWVYDGAATRALGFFDNEHTDSTGASHNYIEYVNATGQVAGTSARLTPATVNRGWTTWLFDGTTTTRIGIIDEDHTRTSYKAVFNYVKGLNEAGQVVGTTERFFNGTGHSAWIYDGTETIDITLHDPAHTGPNGEYEMSFPDGLVEDEAVFNDNGMVAGRAVMYHPTFGNEYGYTAWLWDGTQLIDFTGLAEGSSGLQQSTVLHINDDGSVLGEYVDYALDSNPNGLFYYSAETGILKVHEEMDESWDEDQWTWFEELQVVGADGVLGGHGGTTYSRFRPFLVTMEPVTSIDIDVQPDDAANEVDLENSTRVFVAVLTTSETDASDIKPGTLRLGTGNAAIKGGAALLDVDGDADQDMQVKFDIAEAGIVCEDTNIELTGETWSGDLIMGVDAISPVGCDEGGCHP
jgi:hypothetical protein